MNGSYDIRLTVGHVLRHAPAQSAQGREAALIDIAQDLLLRHLHDRGVLDVLAFKGGTALRKVYAGAGGRFSTDLDFAVASPGDDPASVVELLAGEIAGVALGPFRYDVEERRGRYHVRYESDLGTVGERGTLQSKIDVGPPPWLAPTPRRWVHLPIHDRYGGPLPALPVVVLEENLAEKIARLNRRSPARDAYDLVWVMRQPIPVARDLVRRLALLKVWVDQHGLTSTWCVWSRVPDARAFDVERWLTPRRRADFDDEDIGLLTTPPPDLDELGADLCALYRWLVDLDGDEATLAQGGAGHRPTVLRLLGALPGGRMAEGCW
jgi:predicted nucleotidyltransferase component of viral defense system